MLVYHLCKLLLTALLLQSTSPEAGESLTHEVALGTGGLGQETENIDLETEKVVQERENILEKEGGVDQGTDIVGAGPMISPQGIAVVILGREKGPGVERGKQGEYCVFCDEIIMAVFCSEATHTDTRQCSQKEEKQEDNRYNNHIKVHVKFNIFTNALLHVEIYPRKYLVMRVW